LLVGGGGGGGGGGAGEVQGWGVHVGIEAERDGEDGGEAKYEDCTKAVLLDHLPNTASTGGSCEANQANSPVHSSRVTSSQGQSIQGQSSQGQVKLPWRGRGRRGVLAAPSARQVKPSQVKSSQGQVKVTLARARATGRSCSAVSARGRSAPRLRAKAAYLIWEGVGVG
jgi:hypothetical protein